MWYLQGSVLIAISLVLLLASIMTLAKFDKCAIPVGDWNIGFSILVFMFGMVFMFSDSRRFSEGILKHMISGTMILMILVFVWGDFYLVFVVLKSVECIWPIFLVVYAMVMLVGTVLALVEGFSILRGIIE